MDSNNNQCNHPTASTTPTTPIHQPHQPYQSINTPPLYNLEMVQSGVSLFQHVCDVCDIRIHIHISAHTLATSPMSPVPVTSIPLHYCLPLNLSSLFVYCGAYFNREVVLSTYACRPFTTSTISTTYIHQGCIVHMLLFVLLIHFVFICLVSFF